LIDGGGLRALLGGLIALVGLDLSPGTRWGLRGERGKELKKERRRNKEGRGRKEEKKKRTKNNIEQLEKMKMKANQVGRIGRITLCSRWGTHSTCCWCWVGTLGSLLDGTSTLCRWAKRNSYLFGYSGRLSFGWGFAGVSEQRIFKGTASVLVEGIVGSTTQLILRRWLLCQWVG